MVVKSDPEARQSADILENWLSQRGVRVLRKNNPPDAQGIGGDRPGKAPKDLDCIFVLGGDGTFLSAVRWIGDRPIPVMGIKFGEVGFLSETSEEGLLSAAETVLEGGYETVRRMRLKVRVARGGRVVADETVLNDVVINRGTLARLAYVDTFIDGQYLTTYVADGLIVGTPTGSTAYSLAAGGPIIHPGVPGIIVTPICPFTLTVRPLILPDSVEVRMRLAKKTSDVMLTFDGQAGLSIDKRDDITMTKSPHPIHMIHVPGHSYFEVLKTKLRWGGGRV